MMVFICFCDRFYPSRPFPSKLPVLLYLHGGSWVSGDRFNVPSLLPFFVAQGVVAVGLCCALTHCLQGGVAVSASYRLAPKDPFPAHIQDCNAALAWVMQNISSFGGDPKWIIVSGGL